MERYIVRHDLSCFPLQKKYQLCGFPLGKKYRSHFEIIALMVEAARDRERAKFSIMKHANINCSQFDKFLRSLVEMNFMEEFAVEGRPMYRASERGLAFLRQYYVLLSMLLVAENDPRSPAIIYEPEFRHK